MRWIRKLLGRDFRDPEVGQVWRSENSGKCIVVTDVTVTDQGGTVVCVRAECGDGAIPPGAITYAWGLSQWRGRLHEERRVLIGGGIEPSRPWPRGGNVNPPPTHPRPPAPPAPPALRR